MLVGQRGFDGSRLYGGFGLGFCHHLGSFAGRILRQRLTRKNHEIVRRWRRGDPGRYGLGLGMMVIRLIVGVGFGLGSCRRFRLG